MNKEFITEIMKHRVLIREVHISHREVELPKTATREEILEAAENAEEVFLEYSHTLDSENTTIELDEKAYYAW